MSVATAVECQTRTLRRRSLDHLVGAREQHGWQVEADCLGSDQVEDHIELGCRMRAAAQPGNERPPG